MALGPDSKPEDRLSQLCGKRRKGPEEKASPESGRSPKRFRGCEEEEEVVGRKELEERPKLESSESASDAGVLADTEAKAPEIGHRGGRESSLECGATQSCPGPDAPAAAVSEGLPGGAGGAPVESQLKHLFLRSSSLKL